MSLQCNKRPYDLEYSFDSDRPLAIIPDDVYGNSLG